MIHPENPFGLMTDLCRLHAATGLQVHVKMSDVHPRPANTIVGFDQSIAAWTAKAKAGLITNGVTLAPIMVEVDGQGDLNIEVTQEDYITNRSASSAWNALDVHERVTILNQEGYSSLYSRFLGTACAVVGSDGQLVMARRSMRTATEPGRWAPAIGEGMDQLDICEGIADVRGCIIRGAREELGLQISDEDVERCLSLGSLTVNATSGELVVNGVLDFRLARDYAPTSDEIIEIATRDARDSWERDRYVSIPLEYEALHAFAADRAGEGRKMSGYGLVTAQLALEQSNNLDLGALPSLPLH